MKQDKRRERMLALMGNDPELAAALEDVKKEETPLTTSQSAKQEDDFYEAQAVIAAVFDRESFTEKLCQYCDRPFLTNNPRNVSLCSVGCAQKSLSNLGIDWNPDRSLADRWLLQLTPPPLTVPAVALEHLLSLLSPRNDASQPPSSTEERNQAS